MEEKDKIIVKWAQENVETSNSLLNNNNNNNNNYYYYYYYYYVGASLCKTHSGFHLSAVQCIPWDRAAEMCGLITRSYSA